MQREKVIKLLERLKQCNIESQKDIEKILNYDERVLTSLLDLVGMDFKLALNVVDCYRKTEEILEALNIFKFSKKISSYVFDNVYKVLVNTNSIQGGTAFAGANLILKAETSFQARYASSVLTNKCAIQSGIAYEGANLILKAETSFQARYASSVLRSGYANQSGIALLGTELILEEKEELRVVIISNIVTNLDVICSGKAIEIAKMIKKYPKIILNFYYSLYWHDILKFIKKITGIDVSNNNINNNNNNNNDEEPLSYVDELILSLKEEKPANSDIKVSNLTRTRKLIKNDISNNSSKE